jgi:hypothetical protein
MTVALQLTDDEAGCARQSPFPHVVLWVPTAWWSAHRYRVQGTAAARVP